MRRIKEEMKQVSDEKRYLVTSHDAFHYFARAYLGGDSYEERCVAPEGLAPEGQLSTQDIERVIKHLCEYRIAVVFPESNVPRDALKKIVSSCKAKGHEVRISNAHLYSDAMGSRGSSSGTYLGMMQENADTLKGEWEK